MDKLNCGAVTNKFPLKELNIISTNNTDQNEKELFNFKSVQTAFSTIDIKTTKCKYCEIRSKSQEELTKITKKQEVIKRKEFGSGDLQRDVTEWFEIHSDKVKVKLWGEKLQKLAEKLKKPGGEEKLRQKIEKYLKQVPDQLSEGDDERLELRKKIPTDIIKKLKKMYVNPPETTVSVYRMQLSKYCSRFKMENFKKAVTNWAKTLNIKKKDFMGRNVKKDDVCRYVVEKLEPLVLDRPQSDSEYKLALKSNITEIIAELPLILSTHNKEYYLEKIIDALLNDIFNIENKFPSTYIQPTIKEIKEFVKDEITFFLEKARIAISTKRMEYLETELIDVLLDLSDIVDIDSYVVDDVTTILKDIGKLPEYKAKYFTNLLLKDYKEFFFRESFFQMKGQSDHGRPDVYSDFHKASGMVELNEKTNFDVYKQRLIQEISKWLSKINISEYDKNFIEVVVKDLATDIVDRHRYLLLNPATKVTDTEELEHLRYQIFKWTNKLVGEENTAIIEHAQELMNEINNIPKPTLLSDNAISLPPDPQIDTKPYKDRINDQISEWYNNLPTTLYVSQNESLNKLLIKDLAERIEKGLNRNEEDVIDKQVEKWIVKLFDDKINGADLEQLKNRIKCVPFAKEYTEKDLRHEKILIRSYEDIVDEWLDTVSITPKKVGIFTENKNEIVHELAVKLYRIKSKLSHSPMEAFEKKLQNEISHWLRKLPLHADVDKQNYRDKYAVKLVKKIQTCNTDNVQKKQDPQTRELFIDQLEAAILKWLKKQPFYRNQTSKQKEHHEIVMKELANIINEAINDGYDPSEDFFEYIQKLDPKQNIDAVQKNANQLKQYLQELNLIGNTEILNKEDDILISYIEAWLNNLPLNVTDESRFRKQKSDFIKSMKQLESSGSDNVVIKKEILIFLRALPLSGNKNDDIKYLNQLASNLIQSLTAPSVDSLKTSLPRKNEAISGVIKQWAGTLPLKSLHCPRELRLFIEDMSLVITRLLEHPEYTNKEENDVRLHREIVKFLRRFPLQHERSSDSHISRLAGELMRNLQELLLYNEGKVSVVNNVAVYGFSAEKGKDRYSVQSIKERDTISIYEAYTKKLVHIIDEWFDELNLPDLQREGYREVVINDLASDIVDRHKYIQFNPKRAGTAKDQLEHMKYQIFKWINKLVGEENVKTIAHAADLLERVNKIPVPQFVKPNIQQSDDLDNESFVGSLPDTPSLKILLPTPQPSENPLNSNFDLGSVPPSSCCSSNPPPQPPPAEEGTKEAVYEKYQKIFRQKCDDLPIEKSTPENAKLAELAKTAIYNGIVKTIFMLKSNPEIENDYGYFEFMLEEKIEELLDVLPQTQELINKRHAWKLDILMNAIDMLDQLHSLSDRPSFRQRVRNKFNRKFARDLELEQCFLLQQGFLAEMADAFILESNYKEKDNLKTNIYRNRLMKKIDDLTNHLSKEHNVGFRFFKKAQLARIAMKVLEQVPIPTDDVLQEEAEEIQLADEIEKWYKELPTKPLVNETDGVLRKRMMDLLAKKLYDMQKRLKDGDPSKEAKMKHEMSQFLEKRGKLRDNQDLNINFMVDELNNRLKNRWLKAPIDYTEFEKAKPFSSTFAQIPNDDLLAPLMDATTTTSPIQSYQQTDRGILRDRQSIIKSSRGEQNQGYISQQSRPIQGMSQMQTSQGPAAYNIGNTSRIDPIQDYVSNSMQGPSLNSSPQENAYADYLINLQQNPVYNSRQESSMRSIDHSLNPMTQVGPNEDYISQQSPMPQVSNSPRNQFGPTQVNATQQSQPRTNISQTRGTTPYGQNLTQSGPGSVYVTQQPQSINNTTHRNGRGANRSNQIATSQRLQNINESLGQNFLSNQMGQPDLYDENLPTNKVPYGPSEMQFVSNYPTEGLSPTDYPGYQGSGGPTPIQGDTGQVRGDTLVSDNEMVEDFQIRCRCLEAYRRRRKCFGYDDGPRYKPYKCPF